MFSLSESFIKSLFFSTSFILDSTVVSSVTSVVGCVGLGEVPYNWSIASLYFPVNVVCSDFLRKDSISIKILFLSKVKLNFI